MAGAVAAARYFAEQQLPYTLSLVGNPEQIEYELKRWHHTDTNLTVVPAAQVVSMHDDPATVLRSKPESSLVRGSN